MNKFQLLLSDANQREVFIKSYQNLFLRVSGLLLSYLLVFVIIKLYGGESFGKWAMVTSLFLLSQMILNLGIKSSMVYYFSSFKENKYNLWNLYKKSLIFLFTSSILGVGVINLFITKIAEAYNKVYIDDFLSIILIAVLPLNIIELHAGIFKGLRQVIKFSLLESVSTPLFSLLFVLIFYSYNQDFDLVFIAYVISIVIVSIISVIMLRQSFRKLNLDHGEYVSFKSILSLSIPMFLTESLNSILRWVDVLILGFYCTDLMIGAYNLTVRLTNTITIPLLSINSIAVSKFRELFVKNKLVELKNVVCQSNKVIFWLGCIPFALLIIGNRMILSFFDEGYSIAYWSLVLLALGQLFNVLTGSVGQLLNMTGGHRVLVFVSAVSTLLNLILNFVLIPIYGIIGAAVSTALAIILNNLISTLIIKNRLGFFPISMINRKNG